MASIEPTPKRIRALADFDHEGPVAMINLLRFRVRAAYPEPAEAGGERFEPCSGREAYARYGAGVTPLLAKVGGHLLWSGSVALTVIAPDGEEWDEALIVEYPSRRHFLEMTSSDEYRRVAVHRTAALADSRLIATLPTGVAAPA